MKKGSIRFIGRAASLIICLSLVLSIVSPLSAFGASGNNNMDKNGDGVVEYVVIGSYDAAGFGVAGYDIEKFGYGTAPDGSYADALKKKIEATGKQVNMTQLSIGGMRAEEVRYLLDSAYAGDKYTEENFLGDDGIFTKLGGAAALREKYAQAIRKAEVITLDIGFDNFASYALSYIFENKYEADFSIFDEGMQRSVEEIKGRFEDVLGGYVADSGNEQVGEFLNRAINGLAYALVGYCHSFDAVLGKIYAINSQAQIAVADVRNPVAGLNASMEGLDFPMSLELIYGIIVDLANVYMASLTEYKDMFCYAYLGSGGMNLSEIKAYAGNPGAISADLAARLDASLGADALNMSEEQLLSKRDTMMKLLKAAFDDEGQRLDLSAGACESDIFKDVDTIIAYAEDNLAGITQDPGAMAHLAAAARYSLGAVALLDRAGHGSMAEKLFTAISEGHTGADVIAEDMNDIYAFLANYIDREILIDLEYTFKPYYTCDKDSYYVALGDGSVVGKNSYPEKLAQKLVNDFGLKSDSYKNFANTNNNKLNETPDETLEAIKKGGEIFDEIKKADLITLSYTNLETTRFMLTGNSDDMNWSELVGEDLAGVVGQVSGYLKDALAGSGLDSDMIDVVIRFVEKYAYAYISRALSYVELAEYIHEINPNALVVIVGTYNELDNIEIIYREMVLPLGGLVQYLIDAANLETLGYAAISENTAYIAAPEVETIYESQPGAQTVFKIKKKSDIGNLIFRLSNILEGTLPSERGHKAIADVVLNQDVFAIVGEHDCVYDNDCDNRCNICMTKREVTHSYSAECDALCNLCGGFRVAKPHTYSAICDNDCSVCGETREAAGHTYSSECDTDCNLCAKTRESFVSHSFGEWADESGERVRKCENCGYTEYGEGISVGAIVAIAVLGAVALGGAGFALVWFVIKKKSLTELLALFGKK